MEDDHVDRPGVEERQRLKLTGTNSSIGLIVLIPNTHHQRSRMSGPSGAYAPRGRRTTGDAQSRLRAYARKQNANVGRQSFGLRLGTKNSFSNNVRFADLVVMAERLHPIPFRTRP